ncbi:hypothetical protein E3G49_003408 [Mycobacteroides abscessus]|nr:hypothetical protein [Mycobacteroides abscessus]
MRYRKGDTVRACREIDGMDVPTVPKGAEGIVNATTIFGKPKRVSFTVQTTWGEKRFAVEVYRGDVE